MRMREKAGIREEEAAPDVLTGSRTSSDGDTWTRRGPRGRGYLETGLSRVLFWTEVHSSGSGGRSTSVSTPRLSPLSSSGCPPPGYPAEKPGPGCGGPDVLSGFLSGGLDHPVICRSEAHLLPDAPSWILMIFDAHQSLTCLTEPAFCLRVEVEPSSH